MLITLELIESLRTNIYRSLLLNHGVPALVASSLIVSPPLGNARHTWKVQKNLIPVA